MITIMWEPHQIPLISLRVDAMEAGSQKNVTKLASVSSRLVGGLIELRSAYNYFASSGFPKTWHSLVGVVKEPYRSGSIPSGPTLQQNI